MDRRVKKDIGRSVWESWWMYEDVAAASNAPVGTKIVIDKSWWCRKISFPNSTMETMWWKTGAGYNTMLSFILASFFFFFFFYREKYRSSTYGYMAMI